MPRRRPSVPVSAWTDPRHRAGYAGERAAVHLLQRQGWTILAHRFRAGRHDVDVIARRGSLVAFVEVKTRRSGGFGPPETAVSWKKRRALAWAAGVWVARYGGADLRYRFDVIAVEVSGGCMKTRHIEDAWRL